MRLFKTRTTYFVIGYKLKSTKLSVVALDKIGHFLFGKSRYKTIEVYRPEHSTLWRDMETRDFIPSLSSIASLIEAFDARELAHSLGVNP
jgi:hypothetical protein